MHDGSKKYGGHYFVFTNYIYVFSIKVLHPNQSATDKKLRDQELEVPKHQINRDQSSLTSLFLHVVVWTALAVNSAAPVPTSAPGRCFPAPVPTHHLSALTSHSPPWSHAAHCVVPGTDSPTGGRWVAKKEKRKRRHLR